jgi:DNA ligase-1
MLGKVVEDYDTLRWPMIASPKLDGIRAIWFNGQFYSRTLKPIPNGALTKAMQEFCNKVGDRLNGLDGELVQGDPTSPLTFNSTTRAVMAAGAGIEGLRFHVFDRVVPGTGFEERLQAIPKIDSSLVTVVPQTYVGSRGEMEELEEQYVVEGYEGLIVRNPKMHYKMGRSTANEQGLIKIKRFMDSEAVVIGFEELMHNANEATVDERGYTKRSSHKVNQVPTGRLGALIVRWESIKERKTLVINIGSGFTDAERQQIWDNRHDYIGAICRFKFLAVGMLEAPRHAVFMGWRED